ncbi:melanocortin-2 receptor accessory protein 2A [Thunnus maccoyii]|uniref:melanocortin-2 receptor accessory protein 2A n=1 Tax=Thunnus maccoyii TaxID=8240 RepID=UPI001C4C0AC0|nr:melanocortin-2 receptor accessory protein 2A [Thunnus maccoyii]
MSGSDSPNSTSVPPVLDYEWRYEYYDDEEPVSFEGLRAHRYSIVIGFWVGLAVFVIFMFFLLTLLTKTGAPHPDSGQPCEKRPRLIGFMDTNLDKGAPPPHPSGLDSSCSLFHCYVSKDGQGSCTALWTTVGGVGGGPSGGCHRRPSSSPEAGDTTLLQELAVTANRTEKEAILLAHFNIPNFVNSEQSSTVGEDDLLLGEPELPIILEGRDQSSMIRKHDNHNDFT